MVKHLNDIPIKSKNFHSPVAPPPSCNGVINRARGGTASASTELVSTHAAAMAFDGEKQKTFRKLV